ncbi:hypothetical protein [Halopseudomonas maritima]|uniref:hypothetical protein n=1 Tax=Halopseudomonas maritima TaxID=2918528 RepID=UPI001EEC592F|nr:hypothetical protein [Halopseudomonas maritima]UJJ31561.1 hypothetical protein HV822_17765 [Halopseudomonas maritima]
MHAITRLAAAAALLAAGSCLATEPTLPQLGLQTSSSLLVLHGERLGNLNQDDFHRQRNALQRHWRQQRQSSPEENQGMQQLLSMMELANRQLRHQQYIELETSEQISQQLYQLLALWQADAVSEPIVQARLALLELNHRYLYRSYVGMPNPDHPPQPSYFTAPTDQLLAQIDQVVTSGDYTSATHARWQLLRRMFTTLNDSWAQKAMAPVVVNANTQTLLQDLQ